MPASLSVQVNGQTIRLDADQQNVAATVTAIAEGTALGVPARGWTVVIAAAGTESLMRNLAGGDRDFVGLWQMRPLDRLGTVEQIQQLPLAAQAFYGAAAHTTNPGLLDVPG